MIRLKLICEHTYKLGHTEITQRLLKNLAAYHLFKQGQTFLCNWHSPPVTRWLFSAIVGSCFLRSSMYAAPSYTAAES